MDSKYTRYTDFLKDRQFIRWQLMPDEKLDMYWQDFIGKHPEHVKEIQKAITYLKKTGINKSTLRKNERIALLEKIQRTTRQKNRTKRRKLLGYAFASAAAIALIVIGITLFYPQREDMTISDDKEHIVGELLNSKEIQLITNKESISFQNDIDVKLDEKGKVEITQRNNEIQEIEIRQEQLNTLIIPHGRRSTLTLSDGSKVWLNSGSSLEFPVQFSGKKREIRLTSGEIYIEVVHDLDKPFYVQTANFDVKVYGTKFNLSNYSGATPSVVLVEGSVSLQSEGHKELFITPSEKANYSGNGTFDTQRVDVNQFISWKDGYLGFNKTPMTEVLEQIARYYNLSFDFAHDTHLQKRTCTGKIYLSGNLDNVMTTIALLSSTRYEKDNNRIYITNIRE